MSDGRAFRGWLNPLQFLEVDEPWASATNANPHIEDVLKFLCTPGVDCGLESLLNRYREISTEKRRLFAAPAEDRILEKLIWPLRHAKASYMIGNYLGTISLCGMVTEMVAILLFQIADFTINGNPMSGPEQMALFGSSFEKLGQDRRTRILRSFNIIDAQIEAEFDLVRTTRRKYLHLWSQDHETLPTDAVAVYKATVAIAIHAIGQDVRDGRIYLNHALVKYLEQAGVYDPEEGEV